MITQGMPKSRNKRMKIQSLGVTTKDKDGNVVLAMLEEDMPADCIVVFILKEDYPKLLKLITEYENPELLNQEVANEHTRGNERTN